MARFAVTGLGELMLRYSVPAGTRLQNASRFDVFAGGAEANTISALSYLGQKTTFCSALPDSPIGRLACQPLLAAGVNLDGIVWSQTDRLGIYYIEFSEAPRPIQVIYDRKESAISRLSADAVDWDLILDSEILHITGITAAISADGLELTREAIARARSRGCRVSFDINYRSKLWSTTEAAAALKPMLSSVDHFFCGIADARAVLGCQGTPEQIVAQLHEMSSAMTVVLTLGSEGLIGSDGTSTQHVPAQMVQQIDRLGAGDAMAAGILHGILLGDFAKGLRYGVLMAALALTQHGDIVVTSAAELDALLASDDSSIAR